MQKSKRFLILSLAVLTGATSIIPISTAVAQGDTLVTVCYRGRTIQIPFYLKPRYQANGATNGPCPTSPP